MVMAIDGLAGRFARRFGLLAFGLYHVPLFLNNYPSLGGGGFRPEGLSHDWGHIYGQVGLWVARAIFGATGAMPGALDGDNGDTAEEYCRLLVAVVVGILAASIWTFVDRRRPGAVWVDDALRVLLRYSIALGIASYAVAKLVPVQFSALDPTTYDSTLGELRPMGLLWSLMNYSRTYTLFGGVMEMIVVVLLCFRRTALLGALVCVPVMLNVALMNFCYGVPVKLYSSMIVLSALALVLLDARWLLDVFVFRRAMPATSPSPPFASPRLNRWRWVVKLLVVGSVLVSCFYDMVPYAQHLDDLRGAPIVATWDVTSMTAGPKSWRRLAVGIYGTIVRLDTDDRLRCGGTYEDGTLRLACGEHAGALRWTVEGDELQLDGTFDKAPLRATLKRRADPVLSTTKFRWIYE